MRVTRKSYLRGEAELTGGEALMADIRIFTLTSEDTVEEEIYRIAELAEEADGLVVVGYPKDTGLWEKVAADLERIGARWPRIRFIDGKRDTALSSLGLEDLVELWKEYLEDASRYLLHTSVDIEKQLSRRDIMKRGLSLALRYRPTVDVEERECAALRYCSLCLSECPYLALRGKPPEALGEKCIGCGVCASFCPSGLIYQPAAPPSAVRRVIDRAAERGLPSITVVCPRSRRAAYESQAGRSLLLELPCIASFRALEFLYARLRGIDVVFLCVDKSCDKRPAVEKYLGLIGELKSIIAEPCERPGLKKLILPALLSSFKLRQDAVRLHLLQLFEIEVDPEKCSLCGACASACPTGAMTYTEDTKGARLQLAPSLCVGCSACTKVCPEKAVSQKRVSDAGPLLSFEPKLLVTSGMAHCKVCGKPVAPQAKIRILEKRLREKQASKEVIEKLYLCDECKSKDLIKHFSEYLSQEKEIEKN